MAAATPEQHDAVIHEEHHEPPESRITRVVVVTVDSSAHSQYAFNWALDNFIKPEVTSASQCDISRLHLTVSILVSRIWSFL